MEEESFYSIPDSSICLISHCKLLPKDESSTSMYNECISVCPLGPNPKNTTYKVSSGSNVMIQSASLPILSLATNGRMTPERLWRLVMCRGLFDRRHDFIVEGDIDYGNIQYFIEQHPSPAPGFSTDEFLALESLGDVEKIKRSIILRGMFWLWMRPDR